jgi:acyl-CoA thioester hydrolase
LPFTTSDYVRWADVDLAGIMRYDAYLRLVDVAETDFFRAIGAPIGALAQRLGVWLPRKVVRLEFHAPSRLDDALRLTVYVSRLGRTSLTLVVDVADPAAGARKASVEMVLVCVGTGDFAKRELPAELVDMMHPYVVAGDGGRS